MKPGPVLVGLGLALLADLLSAGAQRHEPSPRPGHDGRRVIDLRQRPDGTWEAVLDG